MRLITLPYSEVCMHMRIAGTQMLADLTPSEQMVQLFNADGSLFSIPITLGEAGWSNQTGAYLVTIDGTAYGVVSSEMAAKMLADSATPDALTFAQVSA